MTDKQLLPAVECACGHGRHVYSFTIETDKGNVPIRLCQNCYTWLKGNVVQCIVDDAARKAQPLRWGRND